MKGVFFFNLIRNIIFIDKIRIYIRSKGLSSIIKNRIHFNCMQQLLFGELNVRFV